MDLPSTGSQNRVWRFFGNPAVGIVGSVASVVGVALAVLFYTTGIREPRLTYYVHPVKSTIASPNENSRLAVFYDKELLQQPVTGAQVAFWNAGKAPIRKENILMPLTITTGSNSPILEVRLRKVSRDIVQVEIDQSRIRQGTVGLKWNILEFGDGGILEVLFLGTPSTPIAAQAVIEGQPDPTRLEFSAVIRSPAEQYAEIQRQNRSFAWVAGGMGTVTFAVGGAMAVRRRKMGRRIGWELLFVLLYPLGFVGYVLYRYFRVSPPGPPFGF